MQISKNIPTDGKKKGSTPFLIFIGFFIAINLLWVIASRNESSRMLKKGESAPDFSLPIIGHMEEEVSLEDLKGKATIVLVFWATWCPACRNELSSLSSKLWDFEKSGIKLVGINLDYGEESIVRAFIQRNSIKMTNLFGNPGVAGSYRVTSLPSVYVLDREGKICWAGTGYTRAGRLLSLGQKCS